MKIELKKVKHAAFLSEETEAYSAEVYVDGKRAGSSSNEGHGGPDHVQWLDRGFGAKVEAYIKSLPPVPVDPAWGGDGKPLPMDVDLFFGQLISAHLKAKDEEKKRKREEKAAAKARAVGQVLLVVDYPRQSVSVATAPATVDMWKARIFEKHGEGVARVLR